MMKAHILIFFIVVCAFSLFICSNVKMVNAYTSHSWITITSDNQFDENHGVVGGDGTSGNPYLISGWEIDTTANGIRIANTTAYYQISNCYVYSTENNPSGTKGIYITNAPNGIISNNQIEIVGIGIYIETTHNNETISSNTVSNCTTNGSIGGRGIYISGCSDVSILSNVSNSNVEGILVYNSESITINSNSVASNTYGIHLNGSWNNGISYNSGSSNTYGIYLTSSTDNNNTVEHNTFSNNTYGLFLNNTPNNTINSNTFSSNSEGIHYAGGTSALYNTITNNTCSFNSSRGIYLSSVLYQGNIDSNTCDNNANGIVLYQCSQDNITNNICNGNTIGITLSGQSGHIIIVGNEAMYNGIALELQTFCYSNTITNNSFSMNDNGAYFNQSYQNDFETNSVCYNQTYGIYLSASNYNIINNNTTNYNYIGLYVSTSIYDNITNNNINQNGYLGISTYLDNYNLIAGNVINSNENNGINLNKSYVDEVSNNTLENNGVHGIYVSVSTNDLIDNNSCFYNVRHGIYLHMANNNTVSNNNCSSNLVWGIYLENSNSNLLDGNICDYNLTVLEDGIHGVGIQIDYQSTYNTLQNNHCDNTDKGIMLDNSSDYTVLINNSCENNHAGIKILHSKNCLVENNNCSNNARGWLYQQNQSSPYSTGIYLENLADNITITGNVCNYNHDGIYIEYYSMNCLIDSNIAEYNGKSGFGCDWAVDNCIYSNNLAQFNNRGFWIVDSSYQTTTHNEFRNNIIENNVYGFWIAGTSKFNIIENNLSNNNDNGFYLTSETYHNLMRFNLIDNSSDNNAYDGGINYWDYNYRGNFWGDWQSPDIDNNGIVDNPRPIKGGNDLDHYPLMLSFYEYFENQIENEIIPPIENENQSLMFPNAPVNLLTNGLVNPTNLQTFFPYFSAVCTENGGFSVINYFAIQVADNLSFSNWVWNWGKTLIAPFNSGGRCTNIPYLGMDLTENTVYYWRIKFWDNYGNEGVWSNETATFQISPAQKQIQKLGISPAIIVLIAMLATIFDCLWMYYSIGKIENIDSGLEGFSNMIISIAILIVIWGLAYGFVVGW
jgi:parallel beta-helix repeat protein